MIVEYSKDFEKEVKKQSGKILQSINAMILEVKLANCVEELTDCKKMIGYENIYRLRIGSLRAFFVLYIEKNEVGEDVVIFEYIVPRGQAYSKEMNEKLRNKDY